MEKEKIRQSAEGEKVRRNKVNMDLRRKKYKGRKKEKRESEWERGKRGIKIGIYNDHWGRLYNLYCLALIWSIEFAIKSVTIVINWGWFDFINWVGFLYLPVWLKSNKSQNKNIFFMYNLLNPHIVLWEMLLT